MNENNLQQKQPNNPVASPETNHSPLTIHHSPKRKSAFTLAEVLITLGIIGIVAALTMSTLIPNLKRKELKSRFKKTDTIVSQALLKTIQELGFNSYEDLDIPLDKSDEEINQIKERYNSVFLSQFKIVQKAPICQKSNVPRLKGYFLENDSYRWYCWVYGESNNSIAYILPDGSSISPITYISHRNAFIPNITVDTNGPYKEPNAFGYDIFFIKAEKNEKIYGMLCDPFVRNTGNLQGCYWYARRNISALNNLDYWDVLYHKKDYWEKLRSK